MKATLEKDMEDTATTHAPTAIDQVTMDTPIHDLIPTTLTDPTPTYHVTTTTDRS